VGGEQTFNIVNTQRKVLSTSRNRMKSDNGEFPKFASELNRLTKDEFRKSRSLSSIKHSNVTEILIF